VVLRHEIFALAELALGKFGVRFSDSELPGRASVSASGARLFQLLTNVVHARRQILAGATEHRKRR
jgi:hypothetical protein